MVNDITEEARRRAKHSPNRPGWPLKVGAEPPMTDPSSTPDPVVAELTMPQRIWLITDAEADERITWSDSPNPYSEFGEQPDAATEYVRADQLTALSKRVAVLEEALEPFAKAADVRLCGEWSNDKHFGQTDVGFYLTFGDLRAARAALPPPPATNGETK